MLSFLRALCVVLAFAAPAAAEPIDDARAAYEASRVALAQVEQSRAELDASHERIAGEIEALKAAGGPLLPGVSDPRLDRKLKQAGYLAEQLSSYDREAAVIRARLTEAREALLGLLDAELAQRRLALAEAPAADRRALFDSLRGLITERQTIAARAVVAQAPEPALPSAPADPDASPDELRELADETRDHAEQVRRQLSVIDSRLDGLRERQRLTRAAMAFQRDGALFAQDERNRTVVRAPSNPRLAVAERGDPGQPTGGDPALGVGDAADDGGQERAPDPNANPEADSADDRASNDGEPESFAGGEGAESDFDDQGAADPAADGLVDEVAAPSLSPGGEAVDAPEIGGGDALLGEAFDPDLLAGDVDDLSPGAVSRQIEALERRKAELAAARAKLDDRRRSLEQQATEMEQE